MMALPHGDADEIALSPDGRFMAMSSWKEPLRLYNVEDGTVLRELPGQQTTCGRSVSFSADNRWVATISGTNEVSVTDVQTGALIQALKAVTDTHGIWFSPDGKHLAVSLARAGLQLWRTDDWTLHWVISAPIYSISFSADGRWLAAETDNNRIGIWQMDDGAVYQTISDRNYQMTLSPDGKELATSSLFGTLIKVWDVATGQLLRTVHNNESSGNLIYSPDGRYLVTEENYAPVFGYIHQLSVRRLTDGQQVATLPAYISIGCVVSTARSDMFAYSDWKTLKIFRWRQY
jgi:WD40 repeat protein